MSYHSIHMDYTLPVGHGRGNVSIDKLPKNLGNVDLRPNVMEYGNTKWTDEQIFASLSTHNTYKAAMKALGMNSINNFMRRVSKLNIDPLSARRNKRKGKRKVSDAQLIQAYYDCNGNGTHMARTLGVVRLTIQWRCANLGLKLKGRPAKKK